MDLNQYEDNSICCSNCTSSVMEPYIQCAECVTTQQTGETTLPHKTGGTTLAQQGRVTLCLHCFSKGVEFDRHQSDHSYSIVKNNFPVFVKAWTALEEMQLLKATAECGYGNWIDIAHKVRTKNHLECESHYNNRYIDNPTDGLPEFSDANLSQFPCPVVYKLSEDPPRPSDSSLLTTEMAGYMAGRGDFMTEHDNFMELDLRSLEFSTDDLDETDTDLKLAVVDVYQRCLKERWRRKKVIRQYGLINMHKNAKLRMWFDAALGHIMDRLRVFAQCVKPQDYEIFVESLNYEQELKTEIRSLQEYRINNLSKLRHTKIYRHLKRSRAKQRCDRHLLNDVLIHLQDENACQTWLQRQAALESISKGVTVSLPNAPRRSAPPLDISTLPGYERLNKREKELCSHIRLVPGAFNEFKDLLLAECHKLGSLKLAQARLLIKIDVNKTRKIYDFLVSEGIINKDPI